MSIQYLLEAEHCQKIAQIAHKYTRNTGIAPEDATQAAYMKILQATQAGKFRQGGVEEFCHWAIVVAKRAILDLVRREQSQSCCSLDQTIPGTDLALLEIIPDRLDLLDNLEQEDLVLRAREVITKIDRRHPHKAYLKLWQGRVQGKSQRQLATELGLTQGAISKRWKELTAHIMNVLGPSWIQQRQHPFYR